MERSNNALEIYREGINFRRIRLEGALISTRCTHLSQALSHCILSNSLNPLNHQSVRSHCDVTQWKSECPGTVRREQFESIYRKSINRRLYTQDQLDKYSQSKNNIPHYGLVDPRY